MGKWKEKSGKGKNNRDGLAEADVSRAPIAKKAYQMVSLF